MSNLKTIRKRITSVKNTQKITRAMKMVAAARLRRAQQSILELRPYALKTEEILASVAARVAQDEEHPLLARRQENKVLVLCISSDRGLAGAFNTNINKSTLNLIRKLESEGKSVQAAVIGRKVRDFLRRRGVTLFEEFSGVFENLDVSKSRQIAGQIVHAFAPGFKVGADASEDEDRPAAQFDAIYLAHNEFKNAITQVVRIESMLPVRPATLEEDHPVEFLYEPNKRALLDRLTVSYVETEIYRALLESVAAEHAARMTAMDNATRNASDMIGALTLQFNRARQAAITKELLEIIGGAEALKG